MKESLPPLSKTRMQAITRSNHKGIREEGGGGEGGKSRFYHRPPPPLAVASDDDSYHVNSQHDRVRGEEDDDNNNSDDAVMDGISVSSENGTCNHQPHNDDKEYDGEGGGGGDDDDNDETRKLLAELVVCGLRGGGEDQVGKGILSVRQRDKWMALVKAGIVKRATGEDRKRQLVLRLDEKERNPLIEEAIQRFGRDIARALLPSSIMRPVRLHGRKNQHHYDGGDNDDEHQVSSK